MLSSAVEFDAEIDGDWKISVPVEYRGHLSSFSRVILLNSGIGVPAEGQDGSDMQRRMDAFNYLDGLLANRDIDLDMDKLREERLSRQ